MMKPNDVVRIISEYPKEFILGLLEWESDFGMTYDDNPESDRSCSYDLGRAMGIALEYPTGDYCDHIYDSYCDKCGIGS